MQAVIAGVAALSIAGCASQPEPIVVPPVAPLTSTVAPIDGQECREYQDTAQIDGKSQPVYGTACRQPDGSWRITNGPAATAGAAPSTQTTTTTTYIYPAYDPWFGGGAFFGGTAFFGGRGHHHHHHHGGGHHGHR